MGKVVKSADLMDKCNLQYDSATAYGIFFMPGKESKTNALFFQRGLTEKGSTKSGVDFY